MRFEPALASSGLLWGAALAPSFPRNPQCRGHKLSTGWLLWLSSQQWLHVWCLPGVNQLSWMGLLHP